MTDATAADTPNQIEQRSSILKLLWIGLYSAFLTLITLGIFQFWARTQQRRQMWKDTFVGGQPMEYTGKGSELFFGAILAFFVLVLGFYGPIILTGVAFAADQTAGVIVGVVVGLYLLLAYIALPGLAVFFRRRYILSRTTLRGVRFEQRGNAFGFAFNFFLQTLLTIITLGIYAPIARLRIASMFWNNAMYGDMPFSFDNTPEARTQPVWLSFWLAWVGNFVALGVFYGGLFYYMSKFGGEPPTDPEQMLQFFGVIYGLLFLAILIVIPLAVWHEAVMIRQVIQLIGIDRARLSSTAGAWSLLWLSMSNLLLIILTLGIGYFAAEMRIWRWVARSMSIEGEVDFDRIEQTPDRGPSTGEGLASALDIGGAF